MIVPPFPACYLHSMGYMCQDRSDNLYSDRIVIVSKSNPPQKYFSDDTSIDLLHMGMERQFVNKYFWQPTIDFKSYFLFHYDCFPLALQS